MIKPVSAAPIKKDLPIEPKQITQRSPVSADIPLYVVALFAHRAEREGEINIHPGDQFRVVRKEPTCYVVEKGGRQYTVPANCMMESNAIPATATTINTTANTSIAREPVESPTMGLQRGIAIADFTKTSANQVSIRKGDCLIIEKRFNHWTLVDVNGSKGWVPSNAVEMIRE